jgi:Icc-related predicted phosphoesterase
VKRAQFETLWMNALLEEGATIVPGMSQMIPDLGGLIVSSLVHGDDMVDDNRKFLEEGARLRRRAPRSPWLVMTHRPPRGPLAQPESADSYLAQWIEEFQPRFVFCGHDHRSSFGSGTCRDEAGTTTIFNAGQRSGGKPCCVEINILTGKYLWLS